MPKGKKTKRTAAQKRTVPHPEVAKGPPTPLNIVKRPLRVPKMERIYGVDD